MNQLSTSSNDEGLDWLFAQAREYPLLSADEERGIDEKKWQTRDALLELFLGEAHSHRFFQQWVSNLLDNPPSVESFLDREHYYVLRREQSDLLKDSAKAAFLRAICVQLSNAGSASQRSELLETLAQLNLPPLLVAGLADIQVGSSISGEVATALRYWRKSWRQAPELELAGEDPSPLSSDHRRALRRQLQAYLKAREQLVNHNLRLVFSIAGKLQSATVPYLDRVQSGVLGLIRAAEKYDHRTGYRFSTYAYNWINQSVRRTLEEQRAIVRLPADVNEQVNRLYRERLSHFNINGEEAGVQVLADRLQVKPEVVTRLQQIGNLSVSLDAPFNNEPDGMTLGDTLSGWTYSPPSAAAEQLSLNRLLMNRLKGLAPQEKSVVALRWGLDDTPPLSRREIADHMSVSTERIRQLENSALGKLRNDEDMAEAFRDYQDCRMQD
ncbi:MAG: sigma-70 family RNA polymerase sigma factor [Halioglobus sp.]